jgi:hypothetical protein
VKTVREQQFGKVRVRLVQVGSTYKAVTIGPARQPVVIEGNDPDELWRTAISEVGRSAPGFWGYADARSRFLAVFREGFADPAYRSKERDYKDAAAAFIDEHVPIEAARSAGAAVCEAANKAFAKTNMATPVEKTRVQALLRSADGPAYLAAVARLADGDAKALATLDTLMRKHGQPSWPCATYLPFFWRPTTAMFLKPQVTRDFAERVGHPFAHEYRAQLNAETYRSLLDLAEQCETEIRPLAPRDRIDVQSFFWVVGAYTDSDASDVAERRP